MPIIVKPISGNLIKDKDGFGKQVNLTFIYRILIVPLLSDKKNKGPRHIKEEENPHNGLTLLSLILKIQCSDLQSLMMTLAKMILLGRAQLI